MHVEVVFGVDKIMDESLNLMGIPLHSVPSTILSDWALNCIFIHMLFQTALYEFDHFFGCIFFDCYSSRFGRDLLQKQCKHAHSNHWHGFFFKHPF